MNNLKGGREVASCWTSNNSFVPEVTAIVLMYSVLPPSRFITQSTQSSGLSYSTRLYRGEEARPRVSVELHTLDIDITRLRRAPKLKQDIPARTNTSLIIAF
jgi:hypothetical protein